MTAPVQLRPGHGHDDHGRPTGGLAAVLFDMDGLLVRTEDLWFAAETEIMSRRGGEWDFDKHRALTGSSLDGAARYMVREGGLDADPAVVLAEMVDGMER